MDKQECIWIIRLEILYNSKKHPCGSSEWEILRVGADFKLKCCGCGHEIMVRRSLVEKNTKNLKRLEIILDI